MPKFVDSQGVEWHPRLDLDAVSEYERLTDEAFFGPAAFARLGTQARLQTALAWCCCRTETIERKLTLDQFRRRFDSQAAWQSLVAALMEAVSDFFPAARTVVASAAAASGPGSASTASPPAPASSGSAVGPSAP